MYTEPLRQHVILPLEKLTNALVSQKYNPFYYHGALPNVFIWGLFSSGLLLFAYYVPEITKAYDSVKYITYELPFGNAFRSVHRYAADGMMIFILLHMFRVWFTDRYREYRIIPWITGIALLLLTFAVGLTGYMLIWDANAVALTNITINLIKQLPLIGGGLASFLLNGAGDKISSYTLTMMMGLHLTIPVLLLVFLVWHYMRITRPVSTPPVALIVFLLAAVTLIAGYFPVELGAPPPVTLSGLPHELEFSALYAWPQILALYNWPPLAIWLAVFSVPVILMVAPYIQKKGLRGHYAMVNKENCTGCSLCYHDCPYEAITMLDRDDHKRFKRLAVVDPARCSNCGLCVGACAFKAIEIPRRESPDVLQEITLTLQGQQA